MTTADQHGDWELVARTPADALFRMEVPGGWLYQSIVQGPDEPTSTAMAFVPRETSEELESLEGALRRCEPFLRYCAALGQEGAAPLLDEIERRGLA